MTWRLGTEGVDSVDAVTGMIRCTNKVRATLSKSCVLVNDDDSTTPVEGGVYACANDGDCIFDNGFNLDERLGVGWNEVRCEGDPVPEQTGPTNVLEGAEGAYLFCYHPEDPDRGSDCGNFVLPPQSAFIVAKGGQYDVLVTKYRLFLGSLAQQPSSELPNRQKPAFDNAQNALSIRKWLNDRNASIRIYNMYGLAEEIEAPSLYGEQSTQPSPVPANSGETGIALSGTWGWSFGDSSPIPITFEPALSSDITPQDTETFYYKRYFPLTYSPVWTPVSINYEEGPKVWFNGNFGADYRYFSGLLHSDSWYYLQGAGGGLLKERTCPCSGYEDGNVPDFTSMFGENAQSWGLCNGPDYAGMWDEPAVKACIQSDKNRGACCTQFDNQGNCTRTIECSTRAPSTDARCIHLCQGDSDCQPNAGSGPNFCVIYQGGCCGSGGYAPGR
jgi:hypothetical protein